jgi:F-type H+-transporting ATPase subunit a
MVLLLSKVGDQMLSLIIVVIALIIAICIIGHKIKKVDPLGDVPKWLIPFVSIVEIINNFSKNNIGKRWKHYAPYFLALGISILFQNICSVFGLVNPTSYLVTNFALAIVTFFMVQITGIRSLGLKGYLASFVGPVKWLAWLFIPMNIVSEFALPISLTLRITGNIIAGNVISMLVKSFGLATAIFVPFINIYFDLMSGVIQTLVFVILTIIFTSMKIDDSEKVLDEDKEETLEQSINAQNDKVEA